MSIPLTLVIVTALLILSAIFCAVETALLSCSRARLHQMARHGNRRAMVALELLRQPDKMLGTILIIMTIIPVASSALITGTALRLFGPSGAAYATTALGIAILLAGEAFPKAVGTRFPDTIALAFARPMSLCMRILNPITSAIRVFNITILKIFGLRSKQTPTFTEADIRGALNLGLEHGAVGPTQYRMLDAVLDLNELLVADVMVHRSAIVGFDVNTPPADIPAVLGKLRHSRLVVWDSEPENLIGILYVRDYLTALAQVDNRREIQLRQHLRPLYYIPKTTPIGHQLLEFMRQRNHLALVVDEYGDLHGLITLEDILEEIVGDIADEYDAPLSSMVEKEEDGSLILPGNMPVRTANRQMGWELPENGAVTLAGIMVETLNHLPAQGEGVTIGNLTLTAINKRGHRIEKIRLTPNDPKEK